MTLSCTRCLFKALLPSYGSIEPEPLQTRTGEQNSKYIAFEGTETFEGIVVVDFVDDDHTTSHQTRSHYTT